MRTPPFPHASPIVAGAVAPHTPPVSHALCAALPASMSAAAPPVDPSEPSAETSPYDSPHEPRSPRQAGAGAGAGAGKAKSGGLGELLVFLRRNEALLRQRREALEAKNAELRAALAARGLTAPRPAMAAFIAAIPAPTRDDEDDVGDSGDEVAPAVTSKPTGVEATAEAHPADRNGLCDVSDAEGRGGGGTAAVPEAGSSMPPRGALHGASRAMSRRVSRDGGQEALFVMRGYDAVFDMPSISHVLSGGWTLRLSPWARAAAEARADDGDTLPANADDAPTLAGAGWGVLDQSEAIRVGVLGLFNGGKTFLLNQLTGLELPSSKRVATRGISMRRAALGGCTDAMLLDTEGLFAPVQGFPEAPGAMAERQETEGLVETLTVRLADYVIYVVDDFTSVDQRAVYRLARQVADRRRGGGFAELIVVHNFRTVADPVTLEHMWRTQVVDLHDGGEELSCLMPVMAKGAGGGAGSGAVAQQGPQEPQGPQHTTVRVRWFKTEWVRHLALVQQSSGLGVTLNRATVALLHQWLQSAYVPAAAGRPPLFSQMVSACEAVVSESIKRPVRLAVEPSADATVRFVRAVPAAPEDTAMDAPRRRAAAARQQEAASGARPAAGEDASEAAAAAPRVSPPTAPTTSAEPAPPRAYVEPPLQLLSAGGGDWLPHVDLSEGPRAFVVLVDLPSLAATDPPLARGRAYPHPRRAAAAVSRGRRGAARRAALWRLLPDSARAGHVREAVARGEARQRCAAAELQRR